MNVKGIRIVSLLAWLIVASAVPDIGAWAQAGTGQVCDPASVVWRRLTYGGENALGQLTAHFQVAPMTGAQAGGELLENGRDSVLMPEKSQVLRMTIAIDANFLFQSKHWTGQVWFVPGDGAALQRTRFKPGSDGSRKLYRYARDGVYRRRAEPRNAEEAGLDPGDWSRISNSFYGYGEARTRCAAVSDPAVLLYISSALHLAQGSVFETCVFNKKVLYLVSLQAAGSERVGVSFVEARGDTARRVEREVEARTIVLRARPLDPGAERVQPFEFLGFEGDVEILVDPGSGIPVRLRGRLGGVGQADVKLTEAALIPRGRSIPY